MAAEPLARGLAKRPWCDDREAPDLAEVVHDLERRLAEIKARLDDDNDDRPDTD